MCPGCKNPVDSATSLFDSLVVTALKHLDKIEHEKFSLINIDDIAQKIVNGIEYYIGFRGVPTVCGVKNEKKCPLSYCYTEIVHREWVNETTVLCVECRSKRW